MWWGQQGIGPLGGRFPKTNKTSSSSFLKISCKIRSNIKLSNYASTATVRLLSTSLPKIWPPHQCVPNRKTLVFLDARLGKQGWGQSKINNNFRFKICEAMLSLRPPRLKCLEKDFRCRPSTILPYVICMMYQNRKKLPNKKLY